MRNEDLKFEWVPIIYTETQPYDEIIILWFYVENNFSTYIATIYNINVINNKGNG